MDFTRRVGDCLVDNVGFQLGLPVGQANDLRNRIADYMATHLDEFAHEDFRDGALEVADGGQVIRFHDILGYIDAIRQPLVWGDERMLVAVAAMYDRPVIVFNTRYLRGLLIYNPNGQNEPLLIYNTRNHFMTAGPMEYWAQRLHAQNNDEGATPAAAAAAVTPAGDDPLQPSLSPQATALLNLAMPALQAALLHFYANALPSSRK
jgi:hypothetical protein